MRTSTLFHTVKVTRLLTALMAMSATSQLMAQAPTSLSYPAANVFIAQVSNVNLSPNLAGNAISYTINPVLPAGLAFNTNTGIISGVPTAASAATIYTITAIGSIPTETAVTTTSIQVTNNFFDNNFATISFGGAGVTVINGVTGATISSTIAPGIGTAAGEVVVYQNVANLSGQSIDCIVKTVSVTSGVTFSAYDQSEVTGPNGTGWNSNDAKFFSPQVSFPTFAAGGGSLLFNFQFILGGSYNTATQTGTNVVLQDVRINSYDVDGNGQPNSNQDNEFGGFSTSEVGSATTLQAPVFYAATGLTTYLSNTSSNSPTVTADPTRVRIAYNNMSDFNMRLGGAAGTAYFFLDFSAGPAFNTAASTTVPSIDLNTNVIGVNNAASGCATNLSFTASGQTNVASLTDLTQLRVSFPTTNITDGVNERIVVNGATVGGTIALNTDPGATSFTLGGIVYNVTGSTTSGRRTLVFQRASGAFTLANAEALVDSLQYNNIATAPTSGNRNFTVNVRSTAFESPNAIFTATLNCVSISGNLFHDVNALVDNTVNATGTAGQFAANGAFVVMVDPVTNQVIGVRGIQAGGAYSFGTITPGKYDLYVSATSPAVSSTFTAATFPAGGYAATAENLGAPAGNDRLADGKLSVTIGSQSVTNANFGLQIPPTTTDNTINNIPNPGGFNGYNILPNTFITGDVDGTVDSIVINSFPTGINYLKIGTTVYTSGGTCPPQVSSCTPWLGSVVIPMVSGNPTQPISVDPAAEGTTATVINFTAWDNGRSTSNPGNVTLNFVGSNNHNLSGNVWNDINGNGLQGSGEALVTPADAGHTFYAVLIQEDHTYSGAGTILNSVPVNTTSGYSFANVPGGNNYTVKIVSLLSAPVNGAVATTIAPHFAPNWTDVSTNIDGVIANNLNTNNPAISLSTLAASKSNLNFGVERLPDATSVTTTVPVPAIGTLFTLNGVGNTPVPPATDPEDGTLGAGSTIVVITLPDSTTLLYSGTPVIAGQVIVNFNPLLLQVQITPNSVGATGTSFLFNYQDAASLTDPTPATYTINWGTGIPLSVDLGELIVVSEGGKAKLNWMTYSEKNNKGFAIEHSIDSRNWKQIGFVASAADGGNSSGKLVYNFFDNAPVSGTNFYRLKQTDIDQKFIYSEVKQVVFGQNNTISIYPNPATNMINVKIADWKNIAAVTIMDINGKVVLQAVDASKGIHLGSIANGNYILQVEQTNGDIASFKIVKQ
ncbi:MAG: T9SS type A sorting domain-containing protein [Taibaiella sp.]